MRKKEIMFNRVAIIGVGLIGGSVGKAIKKRGFAKKVIGFSRRRSTISNALKKKAIDIGTLDLKKAVSNADLIILAAPVKTIIKLAPSVFKNAKEGTIVTDVGSCKGEIVDSLDRLIPKHLSFIGSHPLAGSEKKGVNFSCSELFQNSICIVTPSKKTSALALSKIKKFWNLLGSKVVSLSPSEHDKVVALVSHLPHALSFSLTSAVPEKYLKFASGGMRDTTRIAASDPDIWRDIFIANKTELLKAIKIFKAELFKLESLISSGNNSKLTKKLVNAKSKREKLNPHK